MHKYYKTLTLVLITAALSGCSHIDQKTELSSSTDADSIQTEESSVHMILIDHTYYLDSGRTVFCTPDHADGTIQSVTDSEDAKPEKNQEANFDCLGSSYCILADGAAAVMTDEASGTYELFLADDTVEFQGIYKKKKDLSPDTVKWLNFYYSLSEADRNALSMIPSEFAGELTANNMTANDTEASEGSYLEALTPEELDATEALAQYYFTDEVTSFEGVDQIYPADSSDPQYHNSGLEDDYAPGNIIIYRVLTNLDRRDGNPFRYISIARNSKSDDWKIINSGF